MGFETAPKKPLESDPDGIKLHEPPKETVLYDSSDRPIAPVAEATPPAPETATSPALEAATPEAPVAEQPVEDEDVLRLESIPFAVPSYDELKSSVEEQSAQLKALQEKLTGEKGDGYDLDSDERYRFLNDKLTAYTETLRRVDEARSKQGNVRQLIEDIESADKGDWGEKRATLQRASDILGDPDFATSILKDSKDEAEKKGEEGDYLMPQALKDADSMAHDRLKHLGEREGDIIRDGLKEIEIRSLRELSNYLNEKRQSHEEALGVYRFVLDAGAPGSYSYPPFLPKRADLKERFDYGLNKIYKAEATAAHDLIDFLATEAEAKIHGLEGQESEKKESEDGKTGKKEEEVVVQPPEDEKKTEKTDPEKPPIVPPVVPPEKEKIPEDIPGSREQVTIDAARADYIKARRLRGNVFRGRIGRLFGRTMDLDGQQVDLSDATTLETFRSRYEERLLAHRQQELTGHAPKVQAELVKVIRTENPKISDEDLKKELASDERKAEFNKRMAERMIGLVREEDAKIDELATTGIEKNRLEKLKTKWRQLKKTRLFTGLGLTALAFTGIGGAALVGGRAAFGAATSYTAAEAGLERHRILGIEKFNIGHRGLVDDLYKNTQGDVNRLREQVGQLSKDDVAKELARLRVMRIEKGVALADAGRDGAKTRAVVQALLEREGKILRQSVPETENEGERAQAFAKALSARLSAETTARHAREEGLTDTERRNKMKRKGIAIGAAALTAGMIGGKLFTGDAEPAPAAAPETPAPVPTPEAPAPDALDILKNTGVGKARSVWDVIEAKTQAVSHAMGDKIEGMKAVTGSEGRLTHVLDAIKDKIQADPAAYGLPSDIDTVTAEQLKAFAESDAFNQLMNESLTSKAIETSEILAAADLGEKAVSSIESHNAFYEAVVSHTPGVHFDQEMYNLMDSAREFGMDPAHATELIKEAQAAGLGPEKVMSVLHAAHEKGTDFSGVMSMLHESKDAAASVAGASMDAAQAETIMNAQRGIEEILRGHDNYHYTNQVARFLAEHHMTISPENGTISIDYQGDGVSDKTIEILYGQGAKAANNVSMVVSDGQLHIEVADAAGKHVSSFDLASDGKVLNMQEPDLAEMARGRTSDFMEQSAAHDAVETAARAHVEAAAQHTEMIKDLKVAPGRFANKLLKFMETYREQADSLNAAHVGSGVAEKIAALPAQEAAGNKGDLIKLIMEKTSVSKAEAQKLAKPLNWIFDNLKDGGVELTEKDTVKSVLERIYVSK